MKASASIFALGSALVVASTVLAADTSSQPLTRADCGKAGMLWNEGANVCVTPGGESKVASQAGRTPARKHKVANWAGSRSRYAQAGPNWYGRDDQSHRFFFGRLFGGP